MSPATMSEFFRHLNAEDRLRLEQLAERRHYGAEETILAEGDHRHAIFALRAGEARVVRAHADYFVEISRLGPGQIFGEMSFLEGAGASASVVADQDCEVDVIDGRHVEALIETDPGFHGRFYQSIAEILSARLRETNEVGIAEYSWGGRVVEPEPDSAADDGARPGWGGGSPLRDDVAV